MTLLSKLLAPLVETGLVSGEEFSIILSNLRHLARHGTPVPAIQPKFLTPQETAELLALSYSNFRAIEATFPFRRRTIGKSVRFLNTEVIDYMLSSGGAESVSESRKIVPEVLP